MDEREKSREEHLGAGEEPGTGPGPLESPEEILEAQERIITSSGVGITGGIPAGGARDRKFPDEYARSHGSASGSARRTRPEDPTEAAD